MCSLCHDFTLISCLLRNYENLFVYAIYITDRCLSFNTKFVNFPLVCENLGENIIQNDYRQKTFTYLAKRFPFWVNMMDVNKYYTRKLNRLNIKIFIFNLIETRWHDIVGIFFQLYTWSVCCEYEFIPPVTHNLFTNVP